MIVFCRLPRANICQRNVVAVNDSSVHSTPRSTTLTHGARVIVDASVLGRLELSDQRALAGAAHTEQVDLVDMNVLQSSVFVLHAFDKWIVVVVVFLLFVLIV